MDLNPIRSRSAWQFVTSSTGGLGLSFFAAEGGQLYLNDPSGSLQTFRYGTVGGGLSAGVRLPRIGKIQIPIRGQSLTGTFAPTAFPSTGEIYILDSFEGTELTHDDISGVCGIVEVSGGLIAGAAASVMLLGMDTRWALACLGVAVTGPFGIAYPYYRMLTSATALLWMAGVNLGIQGGGGVVGCTGYLG